MSMNLSNISVLAINSGDYCCSINGISKYEAVNVLQKSDLNEKRGTLKNNFSLLCIKDGKWNYNGWWYWHWKTNFTTTKALFLKDADIETSISY